MIVTAERREDGRPSHVVRLGRWKRHPFAFLLRAKRASFGGAMMGLMDFEARGRQEPQVVPGCTPRTPDDEATKKGANPNHGTSDELYKKGE